MDCDEIELIMKDDPEEMEKAAQASWLCRVFQENNLDGRERLLVLKRLVKELKQKREGIRG